MPPRASRNYGSATASTSLVVTVNEQELVPSGIRNAPRGVQRGSRRFVDEKRCRLRESVQSKSVFVQATSNMAVLFDTSTSKCKMEN